MAAPRAPWRLVAIGLLVASVAGAALWVLRDEGPGAPPEHPDPHERPMVATVHFAPLTTAELRAKIERSGLHVYGDSTSTPTSSGFLLDEVDGQAVIVQLVQLDTMDKALHAEAAYRAMGAVARDGSTILFVSASDPASAKEILDRILGH